LKITEKELRYVADLANLALSDDEIHRLEKDMDGILTHIQKLQEADTTGVEPMAQVLSPSGVTATLRPDLELPSLENAEALRNAPQNGAGYFKVPKVIER
jgi:aspartyl-tRNA(Asn)/glutamyl-tRNA(Gln) amidotransferase subunit C